MGQAARGFDVVVWGATGYTGRLVCEQIAKHYQGKVSWALAGRSVKKLEGVRADLTKFDKRVQDVPILIGTLEDPSSLENITQQTKVLISTAGPYMQMGTPVVEACVKGACHYCDLTAEIPWMLDMRDKFEEEAKEKGVCITHSCGFDSIPSDMTALMAVDYIKNKLHKEPGHMDLIVVDAKGGASGGTIMSGVGAVLDQPPEVVERITQPYCLNPPGTSAGADGPDSWSAQWVPATREWALPFIMQFINSPNVRKSATLLEYGPHFGYREVMRVKVPYLAIPLASLSKIAVRLMKLPLVRRLVLACLPKLGEGPSRKVIENGFWTLDSYAQTHEADGRAPQVVHLKSSSGPHGDPGYMSTSRMLLEAALCLALQADERHAAGLSPGGFPTTASAMGTILLERLRSAGFVFQVKSVDGKPV